MTYLEAFSHSCRSAADNDIFNEKMGHKTLCALST
uniref:Uncharacterized protein n=1 Tax=Arundo donax TaxID=35708 RepID=A0A0A9FVC7_ARUDO